LNSGTKKDRDLVDLMNKGSEKQSDLKYILSKTGSLSEAQHVSNDSIGIGNMEEF